MSGYYAKTDDRIAELKKAVDVMYTGVVSLKQAATACFPFEDAKSVEEFARRGDMIPLRLRLASTPFRGIKRYATDILTAIFSKDLIAFEYTWPSPQ